MNKKIAFLLFCLFIRGQNVGSMGHVVTAQYMLNPKEVLSFTYQ